MKRKYIKTGNMIYEFVEFNKSKEAVVLSDSSSGMVYNPERGPITLDKSVNWEWSNEYKYFDYLEAKIKERPKLKNYKAISGIGAFDYVVDVNKYFDYLEAKIKDSDLDDVNKIKRVLLDFILFDNGNKPEIGKWKRPTVRVDEFIKSLSNLI